MHLSTTLAVIIATAAFVYPRPARCEELPDDVRFFDTNEEFDTLDEELGGSQDVIIELYLDVAAYFYGVEKYADAITTYASALDKDPQCAPAWYGMARCYAQTGESAKSITALEKAVFLKPEYKTKARSDEAFEELEILPRFKAVVGEEE
jgi:tetratricopeptide (TPR) repeat protein